MIVFQILIAWLLADLLTGFVHWFEDAYMDSFSLNFLDSLAKENDLHHRKPTAMLASHWFTNIASAVAIGWPLAIVLLCVGLPPLVWLVPFFASLGNLIHRWGHMPDRMLPPWIKFMQWTGLFITFEHHDAHHRSMKQLIPKHLAGYRFCPMTNWVNPIVDSLKFWQGLEYLFGLAGLRTTASRKA